MPTEGAPAPIRSFICKVATRCDLKCDYCYVYEHADQSWRQQPARMSTEVATLLGQRIAEHGHCHNLTAVDVVFHGGEPLIVGLQHLRRLCETIRQASKPMEIRFRMQTNGVLFDEAALNFCVEQNMTVGLSCDGPRLATDRHRLDHFGRSSFDRVCRALDLLSSDRGREIWGGFLTVIDLENPPAETYRFLRGYEPKSIEFLLPLGNHDLIPAGMGSGETPYADWLLAVFAEWYAERPQTTLIRRFRDVIGLMAGLGTSSEEWGLQPVDFAVVEANGEMQIVDTLKTAFEGANHIGLNLREHDFDDMLRHPSVRERQAGASSLCATCQKCPLVAVCGGGYYPHRYSASAGFDNPSVYCADLQKLIRTVHAVVSNDLKVFAERPRTPDALVQ